MISKVAGLLALVAGAVDVAVHRRVRLLAPVHMMMAGFILWSGVTLTWSIAPEQTALRIITYLQLFVLVLVISES
jgi:hypothetical protein